MNNEINFNRAAFIVVNSSFKIENKVVLSLLTLEVGILDFSLKVV